MLQDLTLIPNYPQFIPLSLSHKPIIDSINQKLQNNTSPLNFTNLFIVDTNNDTRISKHKKFMIISQIPIGDVQPITLFLPIDNTYSLKDFLFPLVSIDKVYLFPQALPNSQEDRDNADYLYSIDKTLSLQGSRYAPFRRKLNQAQKQFLTEPTLVTLPPNLDDVTWNFLQQQFRAALRKRYSLKESLSVEKSAIEKLLQFRNQLGINVDGIFKNDQLISVVISEIIPQNTLLIHIFRTENQIKGLAELTFYKLAEKYKDITKLINFEQDLGIKGLRQFKANLCPEEIRLLYTVHINS